LAIRKARKLVRETGDLSIPLSIRNAPTNLMKEQGYSSGYKYAHDFPENFAEMEFLPKEIKGSKLYEPGQNARESDMRKRLKKLWKDKYGY
jgi:putative ATPase